MAKRPAFFIHNGTILSKQYTFEWFPGFAISQKQKSIESLHTAILQTAINAKPLEISTKSTEPLGVKLSAFNLKLNNYALENIFRAPKFLKTEDPILTYLKCCQKKRNAMNDYIIPET